MTVKAQSEVRYTAPALEKGLEILELLAEAEGTLTQKQITGHLGRSVSEIFRMLSVLEDRGYVSRDAQGGYLLTTRLYELAHRHPPLRRLVATATPVLKQLAEDSRQSCYLVVLDGVDIVVVAQADPPTWRVLSVKLGARFDLQSGSTSALVLAAFHSPSERESLIASMKSGRGLVARIEQIGRDGFAVVPAARVPGVTDVSAPVFDALGRITAALSVNYLPSREAVPTVDRVRSLLVEAAAVITSRLGRPHQGA